MTQPIITDMGQVSQIALKQIFDWMEPLIRAKHMNASSQPRAGGSGITEVTSDDLTVTVSNPTGPIVDLSVSVAGSVLMAGAVYNDADIIRGTGFAVTLVTAGSAGVPAEYTVTFDTPLAVIPVTLLTVNNNNGPIANDSTYQAGIKSGSETVNGFSVLTRAFSPTAPVNDGGWNFACFAPSAL